MKRIYLIILSSLLLLPAGMKAQDTPKQWTLRDCLDYALEHNIQVKKSKVARLSGQEDTELAKAQLFPSLSASVTQGFVNYPSSEAVNNNSYTGNYSVNASWKLFDGNKRVNTIKQQQIQNKVEDLSVEQSEDDIQISLVQTYMQVQYATEAVRISRNAVEVSEAQRNRAAELLKAGSISQVDFAQLESQLSTDKYQLVVAETNLDNYKLELKQLLELDITEDISISVPSLTSDDVLVPLPDKQDIYNLSLSVMPQVKSSELSIDIAELDIKKARAGYLPSLSLNAGIGTGHLSGTDYAFGSQVWNKFNESIGLTLSIPIFTNRENKTAVNKAKLAVTTSQLELLNTQKALLKTVEGIYLDATSSQTQYTSASENLSYVKQSYDLTQEQFFLGMKNTVELLTEKNNYLSAQQQVLQSKYMAVMSIELLNIYQKKPITGNY
jgi:outer membrane protein